MLSVSEDNLDRLEKDVEYINGLLSKLSYDSPFPFPSAKPATSLAFNDRLRSTHILLQLLNARLKDSVYRSESEHRIALLEAECEKLRQRGEKSFSRLEMVEAENRRLAVERAQLEEICERANRESEAANQAALKAKQLLVQKEKHFLVEIRKKEGIIEKLKGQLQDVVKDPMLRELRAQCNLHRPIISNEIQQKENTNGSSPPRVEILEDENAKLRGVLSRTFTELKQAVDQIAPDEQWYNYDLSAVPLDWVIEELAEDMKHCTEIVTEALQQYHLQNTFEATQED